MFANRATSSNKQQHKRYVAAVEDEQEKKRERQWQSIVLVMAHDFCCQNTLSAIEKAEEASKHLAQSSTTTMATSATITAEI